jgi:hypothetical protein
MVQLCVLLFLEQIRNARSTTEQTPKQTCVACFTLEMSGEYRNEIIRGLSSMMLGNWLRASRAYDHSYDFYIFCYHKESFQF